jgi:hypothetical protein
VSNLSPQARALLDAGRAALRPTTADRDRITVALRARIGDATLPSDTQAPSAIAGTPAGSAVGWSTVSGLFVGLLVAGGGLWYALSSDSTSPIATAVAASAPSVAPPVVLAPAPASQESNEVSPLPPAEAPAPSSATRRPSDRLAEEVAILSRAETELHAGRY